jgi:hypothetical protein
MWTLTVSDKTPKTYKINMEEASKDGEIVLILLQSANYAL